MTHSPSFTEIFEIYCIEKLPKPDTKRSYLYTIKAYISKMGITHPHLLDKESLIAWRDNVISSSTNTTFNSYLRQMRALCNFAISLNMIDKNPFHEIGFIQVLEKHKKTVEDSTLKYALSIVESEVSMTFKPSWFWVMVIKTFRYTGMRRTQLIGLRWDDISFDKGAIFLRAENSKTKREWYIPIGTMVEDFKKLRKLSEKVAPRDYFKKGQVFNISLFNPRVKTDSMTVDQVSRFFRVLKNHLQDNHNISAHKLRHSFGTEATKSGDLVTVQKIMGHSDIRTTSSYVHPDLKRMQKIMDKSNIG